MFQMSLATMSFHKIGTFAFMSVLRLPAIASYSTTSRFAKLHIAVCNTKYFRCTQAQRDFSALAEKTWICKISLYPGTNLRVPGYSEKIHQSSLPIDHAPDFQQHHRDLQSAAHQLIAFPCWHSFLPFLQRYYEWCHYCFKAEGWLHMLELVFLARTGKSFELNLE